MNEIQILQKLEHRYINTPVQILSGHTSVSIINMNKGGLRDSALHRCIRVYPLDWIARFGKIARVQSRYLYDVSMSLLKDN